MWNPITGGRNSLKSWTTGLYKIGHSAAGINTIRRIFSKTDSSLGKFVMKENGDFDFSKEKIETLYHAENSQSQAAFSDAVAKFNLSNADLVKRRNQYIVMSIIYGMAVLIIALSGLYFSGLAIPSALGVMFIPAALWHRYSHKAYQIRVSSLCSVKQWMSQPHWYAESFVQFSENEGK